MFCFDLADHLHCRSVGSLISSAVWCVSEYLFTMCGFWVWMWVIPLNVSPPPQGAGKRHGAENSSPFPVACPAAFLSWRAVPAPCRQGWMDLVAVPPIGLLIFHRGDSRFCAPAQFIFQLYHENAAEVKSSIMAINTGDRHLPTMSGDRWISKSKIVVFA